ncbi:MAG: TIGR01212 family radical SAM protein [Bacilli bacterium]|nr:TIGR01212 family radical SAM protein [Bacilli bacterium]
MINRYNNTNNNKRYYTLDYYYKNKYKNKIAKISLNGGFTCPNKDGSRGTGGCIYCSKLGSGDFAGSLRNSLIEQFYEVKEKMDMKWPGCFYIGYFQANTNTYAKVDVLKQKYEPILELDKVVGLAIATRPDAINDECLEYLDDLNKRTNLTIELGLQSIHEETTNFINRGHDLTCFVEMVKKLRDKNIEVVVHIINGFPNETKEMMIETIKFINKLDIQGIKIHMLHVIKNTKLEDIYMRDKFHLLTKEEYVDIVCDQIEILNKGIVIHRVTGDADKDELISPIWTLKKLDVIDAIDMELEKRGTYQGFNESILNRVRERMDKYVKYKDIVIDATLGNGKDALFLVNKVKDGYLFGFDIQEQAIENTKELLKDKTNYQLFNIGHENMLNILENYKGKISLINFNLGFLPKGDKSITTKWETTMKAIEDSLVLLNNKGRILITIYPGHPEGKIEKEMILKTYKNKIINYYYNDDKENSPFLIELGK